jgi:hypothetical protein
MAGDTALVGAGANDVGANVDQGSAYVFIQPRVTITPNSGPKGTPVTLTGEGFAPGEQVKFKYKTGLASPKPPAVALCSAIANGNGTATCSGTIPTMNSGPVGAHTIVAKGTTSLIKVKTTFTRT